MNNILFSVANVHQADIMLFNYEKNLLIEGTPLCYRKHLFGLFPSSIHIKPAIHMIPKKKARPEPPQDLFFDDIMYMNGDMNEEEAMFDDEGFDDMVDEEFLNRNDDFENEQDIEDDKVEGKDEEEIMEGDIVVVTPDNKQTTGKKVRWIWMFIQLPLGFNDSLSSYDPTELWIDRTEHAQAQWERTPCCGRQDLQ